MKHYLKIYQRLLKMNFSLILAYRVGFINSVVSTIGWGIFQIIWVTILTHRIKSAFGWSKDELILLAISYVIVIAVFHLLFSRNLERLSRIIDKGELDTILLKPVDSQFLVSTWIVRYANFFRIFLGLGFLFYLTNQMGIHLTFIHVLSYLTLIFFGLMLLYSLWFIFSTILIWSPQLNNLIDFLYTINGMARYPTEMVKTLPFYLLPLILPFTITIVTPTRALFGKVLSGDIFVLLILAFLLFYLSRRFWKFALRYYTSASS